MARVLVVDDEQTDRVILGSMLEGTGHQVFFASDGGQALRIYLTRSIEVVVTDLHMPHVNGLEFIVALRAMFSEAKIIAVSGKGPGLLSDAEDKGVRLALTKPVDPHLLLEAVAQAAPGSLIRARRDVG